MTTDDRPKYRWNDVVANPGLAFFWVYVMGFSLVLLLFFIEGLV